MRLTFAFETQLPKHAKKKKRHKQGEERKELKVKRPQLHNSGIVPYLWDPDTQGFSHPFLFSNVYPFLHPRIKIFKGWLLKEMNPKSTYEL